VDSFAYNEKKKGLQCRQYFGVLVISVITCGFICT